jgi:hypothetical protein
MEHDEAFSSGGNTECVSWGRACLQPRTWKIYRTWTTEANFLGEHVTTTSWARKDRDVHNTKEWRNRHAKIL